jgi:hypothetical protein
MDIVLPGQDPLEAEMIWICDRCVEKGKWIKRFPKGAIIQK